MEETRQLLYNKAQLLICSIYNYSLNSQNFSGGCNIYIAYY